MKKSSFLISVLSFVFFLNTVFSLGLSDSSTTSANGAFYTGEYQNLFSSLLNKSEKEIDSKIEKAFQQFFYGDDSTERLYYPVGDSMAYILDINNNDVRTEGMSYGMMISLQMDKQEEFNKIWKWAKTYMQHKEGKAKHYFAWHCKPNGEMLSWNSASDGEEWFVTALLFASARWGDGEGIYNYNNEAQNILDAMLSKKDSSNKNDVITNMFNKKEKKVVFVPVGNADDFTDPSYHLPHFYELWARWDNDNKQFWYDAADTSRNYFKRVVNKTTGLAPDYSLFDGTPYAPWDAHDNFQYDAWRVAMNIAMDYEWFAKDDWQVFQSNRLLDFFYSKGIDTYGSVFTLEGEQLMDDHSVGLIAMNAVAALASSNENKKKFLEALWEAEIPTGQYRYYDGLLYLIGLLQVSGNFNVYHITE